jgi:hypothetical protein
LAKLILNGSTSGSVTLESPAVSGTTTLTLPTTSGTVVVTSGAQTIEFADGSASTPSITNSGDTNTGIFFSAADTIDFAEGGTAVGQFDSSANFKFNSGYGSVATAYGCRAWVNFNGTSTVSIRASGNVTSITDNGTGDYTVNFTNAMPDANYSVSGSVKYPPSAGTNVPILGVNRNTNLATGSVRINTTNVADTVVDPDVVSVAVFR